MYRTEQSQFLSLRYCFLLLSIPLILIGIFFYPSISAFLSRENPIVKDYLWLIPFTGLCMAYFEIFYAWARVNMHSLEILLKK
jgi:Na+-driven multidrug efflux pump